MKLIDILKDIDYELIQGDLNKEITDISYDYTKVDNNNLFVCLIGIDVDRHDYVEEVVKQGANTIVICHDISVKIDESITIIKVDDTRVKLAYLSENFFEHPQDKLTLIGITGTKGKTTTSGMIRKILELNNDNVAITGTNGTYINGELYEHKNTTPESYILQKLMSIMVKKNVKYFVMEVSSQALKVGRVDNLRYEYGIFTNLSIDHVGPREHPTYENYRDSKAKLFKKCKYGILNCDELEYENMIKDATCKIITYGKKSNDYKIGNINPINKSDFLGINFKLNDDNYDVCLPGDFIAYNATCAISLCKQLGIKEEIIKEGLKNFSVPGRCEIFNINNKYKMVIDFAHNRISTESIIKTMRGYDVNRVITILGCGGGRSFERRYELGEISGKYSDLTIITTDNPRNDNIDEINEDIKKGVLDNNGKCIIIKDREEAIKYAMDQAQNNDIILLLGKGHECFQEIKGEKYYFSEKEIIMKYKGE